MTQSRLIAETVVGDSSEPVAQDREVVRAEIPDDADVGLMQPEVDATRRDEVELAERPGVDQLLDEHDRRAVEERVARHENAVQSCGEVDELAWLPPSSPRAASRRRRACRTEAPREARSKCVDTGVAITTASTCSSSTARRGTTAGRANRGVAACPSDPAARRASRTCGRPPPPRARRGCEEDSAPSSRARRPRRGARSLIASPSAGRSAAAS